MVIVAFQVKNKLGKARFFQETFLLANTSMKVVLRMPFLTLSNVDIQFAEKELTWRTYITKDTLLTTCWVEFLNKKKFAELVLDENVEAFIVHVPSLTSKMTIYPAQKEHILLLLTKKVTVPSEDTDFVNVVLKKSAKILPKRTGIYEYAIKLEDGKQPLYRSIYSLSPVELETFKTYTKTHRANGFIQPLKSPVGALILFVQKPNISLCLCVHYSGLNNLIIRNSYILPLIGKSLNWLGRVKRFIQLDLTSAYHQIRIQESNEWKTVFKTRYGYFKYQVMPFGLSNARASFQDYINKILAKKLDIFIIVYLDNILIYTNNAIQAYIDTVWWVF